MAKPARRRGAPPELAVAAFVGAAALPLARLFQPGGVGGVIVLSLALSLGVSWGARRLGWAAPVAWGVSFLALFIFLSARFFHPTMFGIIPTSRTLHAIGEAIGQGRDQIYGEVPPVPVTVALLMYIAGGTWVTTWLAHTSAVWLGNPLLAVASGLPMFILAGALVPSKRLWVESGLFLGAAAWLLFADGTVRAARGAVLMNGSRPGWRAAPALRAGLIATIAAVTLAPSLPGFGSAPALMNRGPGARVRFNPLVAIRPTLDNSPVRTVFEVKTNAPTYYRLTALEHFNGDAWEEERDLSLAPAADRVGIDFPVRSRTVSQTFTLDRLAGPWLPAAYEVTEVHGVFGARIQDSSRALIVSQSSRPRTYEVISEVPIVSGADLDVPTTYDDLAMRRFLALPRTPAEVEQIARSVTAGATTTYRKMLALQNYLRTFTYDDRVAAGHNFKTIVEFLTTVKRGYCEQFAASMAVMARTLGIPSRVVIGFGTGTPIGRSTYSVTTRDAHAWPEIYFPQAGWIAFEPTPRDGVARVPSYAVPPVGVAPDEPGSGRPSTATSSPQPSRGTSGGRKGPLDDPAGGRIRVVRSALSTAGLVILAAILLSGLALVALAVRRRARIRRAGHGREAVRVRYVDFLGWCASAGLMRAPGETPLEHAARVGEGAPTAAEPLGRLATLVEHALWGPSDGADDVETARTVSLARSALRPTLGRRSRVLAALGWGRWGQAPAGRTFTVIRASSRV